MIYDSKTSKEERPLSINQYNAAAFKGYQNIDGIMRTQGGQVAGSTLEIKVGKPGDYQRVLTDVGQVFESAERATLPPEPQGIKAVVISHPHMDHVGGLVRLVRAGFNGPIYATPGTVAFEEHQLTQEENSRFFPGRKSSNSTPTPEEIKAIMGMFVKPEGSERPGIPYRHPIDITDRIKMEFGMAGHILGSAWIDFSFKYNGWSSSLFYAQDFGRMDIDMPVLRDPDLDFRGIKPERQDGQENKNVTKYGMMEATYGGKSHKPRADSLTQLGEISTSAYKKGQNVYMAVFSISRSQMAEVDIDGLKKGGKIPKEMRIIIGSPSIADTNDLTLQFPEELDDYFLSTLKDPNGTPFHNPYIKIARSFKDVEKYMNDNIPSIFLVSSGMYNMGRSKKVFELQAPNKKAILVTCGYQSPNSPGFALQNNEKSVSIDGKVIPILAQHVALSGYSQHMSGDESVELAQKLWPDVNGMGCAFYAHFEGGSKDGGISGGEAQRDLMSRNGFPYEKTLCTVQGRELHLL